MCLAFNVKPPQTVVAHVPRFDPIFFLAPPTLLHRHLQSTLSLAGKLAPMLCAATTGSASSRSRKAWTRARHGAQDYGRGTMSVSTSTRPTREALRRRDREPCMSPAHRVSLHARPLPCMLPTRASACTRGRCPAHAVLHASLPAM
jgi:hypothetical protein